MGQFLAKAATSGSKVMSNPIVQRCLEGAVDTTLETVESAARGEKVNLGTIATSFVINTAMSGDSGNTTKTVNQLMDGADEAVDDVVDELADEVADSVEDNIEREVRRGGSTSNNQLALPGPGETSVSPRKQAALQKLADAEAGTNNKVIDPLTGMEVGRFIADDHGNVMIEPVGGSTVSAGRNGVDTHTLYPNGSNYQRYNPVGHRNDPTPHGHGHLMGTGTGRKGQGASIDVYGNVVPFNSPEAHWSIH